VRVSAPIRYSTRLRDSWLYSWGNMICPLAAGAFPAVNGQYKNWNWSMASGKRPRNRPFAVSPIRLPVGESPTCLSHVGYRTGN